MQWLDERSCTFPDFLAHTRQILLHPHLNAPASVAKFTNSGALVQVDGFSGLLPVSSSSFYVADCPVAKSTELKEHFRPGKKVIARCTWNKGASQQRRPTAVLSVMANIKDAHAEAVGLANVSDGLNTRLNSVPFHVAYHERLRQLRNPSCTPKRARVTVTKLGLPMKFSEKGKLPRVLNNLSWGLVQCPSLKLTRSDGKKAAPAKALFLGNIRIFGHAGNFSEFFANVQCDTLQCNADLHEVQTEAAKVAGFQYYVRDLYVGPYGRASPASAVTDKLFANWLGQKGVEEQEFLSYTIPPSQKVPEDVVTMEGIVEGVSKVGYMTVRLTDGALALAAGPLQRIFVGSVALGGLRNVPRFFSVGCEVVVGLSRDPPNDHSVKTAAESDLGATEEDLKAARNVYCVVMSDEEHLSALPPPTDVWPFESSESREIPASSKVTAAEEDTPAVVEDGLIAQLADTSASFVDPGLEYAEATGEDSTPFYSSVSARVQRDGFAQMAYREHLAQVVNAQVDRQWVEGNATLKTVYEVEMLPGTSKLGSKYAHVKCSHFDSLSGAVCGEMVVSDEAKPEEKRKVVFFFNEFGLFGKSGYGRSGVFRPGDTFAVTMRGCLSAASRDAGFSAFARSAKFSSTDDADWIATRDSQKSEGTLLVAAQVSKMPAASSACKVVEAIITTEGEGLKGQHVLCPANVLHVGRHRIGARGLAESDLQEESELVLKIRKKSSSAEDSRYKFDATIAWIGPFGPVGANGIPSVLFGNDGQSSKLSSYAVLDMSFAGQMTPSVTSLAQRAFTSRFAGNNAIGNVLLTKQDVANAAGLVEVLTRALMAHAKKNETSMAPWPSCYPKDFPLQEPSPSRREEGEEQASASAVEAPIPPAGPKPPTRHRVEAPPQDEKQNANFRARFATANVETSPEEAEALCKIASYKNEFSDLRHQLNTHLLTIRDFNNKAATRDSIAFVKTNTGQLKSSVIFIIRNEKEIWSLRNGGEKCSIKDAAAFDAMRHNSIPVPKNHKEGSPAYAAMIEWPNQVTSRDTLLKYRNALITAAVDLMDSINESIAHVEHKGIVNPDLRDAKKKRRPANKAQAVQLLLDTSKKIVEWHKAVENHDRKKPKKAQEKRPVRRKETPRRSANNYKDRNESHSRRDRRQEETYKDDPQPQEATQFNSSYIQPYTDYEEPAPVHFSNPTPAASSLFEIPDKQKIIQLQNAARELQARDGSGRSRAGRSPSPRRDLKRRHPADQYLGSTEKRQRSRSRDRDRGGRDSRRDWERDRDRDRSRERASRDLGYGDYRSSSGRSPSRRSGSGPSMPPAAPKLSMHEVESLKNYQGDGLSYDRVPSDSLSIWDSRAESYTTSSTSYYDSQLRGFSAASASASSYPKHPEPQASYEYSVYPTVRPSTASASSSGAAFSSVFSFGDERKGDRLSQQQQSSGSTQQQYQQWDYYAAYGSKK